MNITTDSCVQGITRWLEDNGDTIQYYAMVNASKAGNIPIGAVVEIDEFNTEQLEGLNCPQNHSKVNYHVFQYVEFTVLHPEWCVRVFPDRLRSWLIFFTLHVVLDVLGSAEY